MGRLVTLILLVFCEQKYVSGQTELYPDFSQCSSFTEAAEHGGGEVFLRHEMEICSAKAEDPEQCFKKCIFQTLGLFNIDIHKLRSANKIAKEINRHVFPDQDEADGKRIAEKIREKCTQKFNSLKGVPCDRWTKFFTCVEKVIKTC